MGIANRILESKTILNCNFCGIGFEKRTDHVLDKNYCSKKCRGESRKNHLSKWGCGKPNEDRRKYFRQYFKNNPDKKQWDKENA